ncbi:MAG: hypothetical protein M3R41_06065 [Pseudomonadota bacterium]|nr:hypothetical protein [Pseudomonadota bacterium]
MNVAAIALTAIAAAVLVPGQANAAQCKITGVTAPGVSATYDPFDVTFTPSPVSISIQTRGDNCAGAKVELALVTTTTSPNTGSQVRLVNGGSVILGTVLAAGQPRAIVNSTAAFTTNPLLLTVGSAGSISGDASLALALQPGQVGSPGVYDANLGLVALLTDTKGNQSTADTTVNVAVTVRASVRVAAGSGQLSINLGELKPGAVGGPITFDAYANVNYNLLFSSDNGFVMRRGGSGSAPGVPYTPTLSNGTISIVSAGGPTAKRQASFTSPNDGRRHHSLSVTVDPFPNLGAGQYSDVMTLEIRARV